MSSVETDLFCLGLLRKAVVQTGCIEAPESGANIIFIEKRRSFL